MWSVQVVVDPPFFDDVAGVAITAAQMLVEALVPEAAIKALDEAVLHRLSLRDVVPCDTAILLPFQHGVRGAFGSVIALTTKGRQPRKLRCRHGRPEVERSGAGGEIALTFSSDH